MTDVSNADEVVKTALTDYEQITKWLSDLVYGSRRERDLFFFVLDSIYGTDQLAEWLADEVFSDMNEDDLRAIKSKKCLVKYLDEIF